MSPNPITCDTCAALANWIAHLRINICQLHPGHAAAPADWSPEQLAAFAKGTLEAIQHPGPNDVIRRMYGVDD